MRARWIRVALGAGAIATLGAGVSLALPAGAPAPAPRDTAAAAAAATPAAVPALGAPTPAARASQTRQSVDPTATLTPSPPAAVHVPRLRRLTPPDVVVRLRHAAKHWQIHRLRHRPGVDQVLVLDRGTVSVPAGDRRVRLTVAGAPLALRRFTPALTARSTKLWRSVARGELTVSYGSSKPLARRLGATLPVAAGHAVAPVRVGALATLDVPGVQAVVSNRESRTLHLHAAREVLIHAPALPIGLIRRDVAAALGTVARFTVTRPQQIDQSQISTYARETIPPAYLDLYRRAAPTCPGLPWTVLAGIGTVETDNGRNVHRSIKGAEGPMQFMPATWREWGIDADGDGVANIHDPVDAVYSAARYLCAAGASRGGQALDDAIYAYNHAWWYVRLVIRYANAYA